MTERLIDVLNSKGTVIHTYPVTLGGPEVAADDAEYIAKALEAAAHGALVPDAELEGLTAKIHVSRGGQLATYGDTAGGESETKHSLEEEVRTHAYFLWEQEGRPLGRADEHWQRAQTEHFRRRAYALWQQEGSPEGRADEYWRRLHEFEAQ
jgi:Protein of unknown function (DUF2934)